MKIILLKDDKKLGKKNSVIDVKDGYGSFLIKQGLALLATNASLSRLDNDIQTAKALDDIARQSANNIKTKLEKDKFIIDISYNKNSQQLNGSITKKDVLEIIKSKYPEHNFNLCKFIDFPKTRLAQIYKAKLQLYKDIVANIEFGVEL